MQSMGEGLGCDRRGWICQSFCQPELSNAHCAELCFRSGMDTEWSENYAKEALDTLGGPKSVSGTRFSVCWWYCGSREYLPPPPPWFSCLRGWRPVAKQPFKSFLSPSCLTAECQRRAACLAVLGVQLRGQAICLSLGLP
ncbi:unnamed protein product [Rangifer tarandus platyrhynchus]|uniref:Uncharacterized protein n=2 Tax=Rangifer tarandus platyrhynchus TaxID=3082113 RepID=A0AC59ZBS3_RANTA|nr:unnamed protein product [Rangifer tarandus platyrhynchus]